MLDRGSEWRRWEPHIHAPGTVMNNQFNGPSAWNDYLTALEQATPVIEAIALFNGQPIEDSRDLRDGAVRVVTYRVSFGGALAGGILGYRAAHPPLPLEQVPAGISVFTISL